MRVVCALSPRSLSLETLPVIQEERWGHMGAHLQIRAEFNRQLIRTTKLFKEAANVQSINLLVNVGDVDSTSTPLHIILRVREVQGKDIHSHKYMWAELSVDGSWT